MEDCNTELYQQFFAVLTEYIMHSTSKEPAKATQSDTVEMLTIKECTAIARGLSEHSIRMLVRKGLVTSIRTGEGKNGKILINKQSLIDYLNGVK